MSIVSLHVSTLELKKITLVKLVYRKHELQMSFILKDVIYNLRTFFIFCRYNVLVLVFELNVTTFVKIVINKDHVFSRTDWTYDIDVLDKHFIVK